MKRIVIASLLLGLLACACSSDEGSGTPGGSAGSGGSTGGAGGSGGSGGAPESDSGGAIPTGTCTEAGAVCATFKFPTITEAPTRLIVGFYSSDLPPTGPPDKTGVQLDMPPVTPGTELPVKMTGVSLDGDYNIFAALYMPGGGQFQTKKGIDYEAFTAAKVTLSKAAPTTLPTTLEFNLAK